MLKRLEFWQSYFGNRNVCHWSQKQFNYYINVAIKHGPIHINFACLINNAHIFQGIIWVPKHVILNGVSKNGKYYSLEK